MPKREPAANDWLLKKIVSGGQTVWIAPALDVAIELGMEHGGWCPHGRLSEDGRKPSRYQLMETDATEYSVRTERNVLDSDGTLILYRQRLQRGTLLKPIDSPNPMTNRCCAYAWIIPSITPRYINGCAMNRSRR